MVPWESNLRAILLHSTGHLGTIPPHADALAAYEGCWRKKEAVITVQQPVIAAASHMQDGLPTDEKN